MNVIDLHAFRVARAIKANSSPDVGLPSDSTQLGRAGSYLVRLRTGSDFDDQKVRAAAIKAHRARTGWTGPVVVGPSEMTKEEWLAKYGHGTPPA